ncbi:MAG: TadE/TadG family type IV pilus assembly protein [Ignavibacteriales bacterium]
MPKRRRGWNSGATAVETALILPVFISFVLGTINLGWALYCGAEVRHAVERSSRLLIKDPTTSETAILTDVKSQLSAADPNSVSLTKTTQSLGSGGGIAKLSWTYAYTVSAPFIKNATFHFDSAMVVPLRY